ncbi:MAG: SusD/RagB family nutrient-binding outer membrane lipoprotein [Longimicrobiales bacterium]
MATRTQIIRSLTAALLVLLTAGCKEFLAVNENPNAPGSARVEQTLPAVITGFGHSVLSGSVALWSGEWMQQFSYNGDTRAYSEIHRYEVTGLNTDWPWNAAYSTVMKEARNIINETEASGDLAYHAIAKFLFAWSYGFLTDTWGPVPYRQAFDVTIRNPEYDEQKTVYEGVHKQLEEAIVEMQKPAPRLPGANDLLFAGNMARWVKLARTVQGQFHLRLAYAPGENRPERAQKAITALQQGIASNAEDADFAYPGKQTGWRQPWWTFEQITQFLASEYYVELLRGLNDPRLPITVRPALFDSVRGQIVYRGHKNGATAALDSTVSRIAPYFSADSAALSWVSFAHVKFMEAEARLILNDRAGADAAYRAGIQANMQKMRVPAAAITTYLAARPSLTTVSNPLQEIITQKYIANFLKAEVWHDWRRTGYPRLQVVEGAMIPGIPQRLRAPAVEVAANIERVRATGISIGLGGRLTQVWWATQGPPQF